MERVLGRHWKSHETEADVGDRTRDLRLTMAALYQLSYVGTDGRS